MRRSVENRCLQHHIRSKAADHIMMHCSSLTSRGTSAASSRWFTQSRPAVACYRTPAGHKQHQHRQHLSSWQLHSSSTPLLNNSSPLVTAAAAGVVPLQQLAEGASSAIAGGGSVLSIAAWVVVGGATVASLFYMAQAFTEAKSAIERREEGEKLKQQEEEARKQKIKDMFERL